MIPALRRKLALLLAGVLCTVILCTALAALILSERQTDGREWARLMAQVERVAQEVRVGSVIRTSELAKTEAAGRLIISIADGGGPIPFRGGWQTPTEREILISRALEAAEGADGDWQGAVTGEHGERYLAAVCFLNDYRNARTVAVLRDMREADAQRRVQRLLYAGIALTAMTVVALFCWFFYRAGRRPYSGGPRKTKPIRVRCLSRAAHAAAGDPLQRGGAEAGTARRGALPGSNPQGTSPHEQAFRGLVAADRRARRDGEGKSDRARHAPPQGGAVPCRPSGAKGRSAERRTPRRSAASD